MNVWLLEHRSLNNTIFCVAMFTIIAQLSLLS
jgi:hypothetical protein